MLYLVAFIICFVMLVCTVLLVVSTCFAIRNRKAGAQVPRSLSIPMHYISNALLCLYFISAAVSMFSGVLTVFYWAMVMVLISAVCQALLEYLARKFVGKLGHFVFLSAIPIGFFYKQFDCYYAVWFFIAMLSVAITLYVAIYKEV